MIVKFTFEHKTPPYFHFNMEIGGDPPFSFSTFLLPQRKNREVEEKRRQSKEWREDSFPSNFRIDYFPIRGAYATPHILCMKRTYSSMKWSVSPWSYFQGLEYLSREFERISEDAGWGRLEDARTRVLYRWMLLFQLFHTWQPIDKHCIAFGKLPRLLVPDSWYTFRTYRIAYMPMSIICTYISFSTHVGHMLLYKFSLLTRSKNKVLI